VIVLGQVELAGAARNRIPVLDSPQEFTFLDGLEEMRADFGDFVTALEEVADEVLQPRRIDAPRDRMARISSKVEIVARVAQPDSSSQL
jgi:hypothetical protein